MTCKNCSHSAVCETIFGLCGVTDVFKDIDNIEKVCKFFKDSSREITLPVKVGEKVYVIKNNAIEEMTVEFIYFSNKPNRFYAKNESGHYNFRLKDLGRTVFRSMNQAKRRLTSCD